MMSPRFATSIHIDRGPVNAPCDTWTRMPIMLSSRLGAAGVGVKTGSATYVYLVGGEHEGAPLSDVIATYLSEEGRLCNWRSEMAYPFAIDHTVTLTDPNVLKQFFVIGGAPADNAYCTTVFKGVIDNAGKIEDWIPQAALPIPLSYHAGVVCGNYVYISGGFTSEDGEPVMSNKVFVSDITHGTISVWTETTALPASLVEHAMASYNGHVYALGTDTIYHGISGDDGHIGSWDIVGSTLVPAQHLTVLVAHSVVTKAPYPYLYVVYPTSQVDAYPIHSDGTLGDAIEACENPYPLTDATSFTVNNRLYIVGGYYDF